MTLKKSAIVVALMLFSLPAAGQEKILASDCVYVQFGPSKLAYDEWLCPDGKAFVHSHNWVGPTSIVPAKAGNTRCHYIADEKAWLCGHISKVLRGTDAPKVQVGK